VLIAAGWMMMRKAGFERREQDFTMVRLHGKGIFTTKNTLYFKYNVHKIKHF